MHPLTGGMLIKRCDSSRQMGICARFGGNSRSFQVSARQDDDKTEITRDHFDSENRFNMSRDLSSGYSQAILGIQTSVSVVLARKPVSLREIMDLVPGSMLTFETHCDQPLSLEAGGTPIATGETVKIGDKFGLRIRHLLTEPIEE